MADINVDEVLNELTLEEKINLIAGADFWHTHKVDRLGVPAVRVSDGPNGVRGSKFLSDVHSACFPCGTGLAATFNKDLLKEAGALMAEEAKAKSAHVILGPTTNMMRTPLGGRAFESFSEDPYLAGMATASIINGMQENDIAATVKHYVGNDLEHERNASNSIITERALREIYLEPFRLAVKYANPAAFMTGYNKVNGEHVSQSKKLLLDILRHEWAWDGLIMSDWFGAYTAKASIENGLDLEMPGPSHTRTQGALLHMVKTRELNIQHLDARVKNVLKFVKWCAKSNLPERGPEGEADTPATRDFLRKIATEAIVLLKNEGGLLPFKKTDNVAVIGPNAKFLAYCGGGSASLRTYNGLNPYEAISQLLGKEPKYSVGCHAHKNKPPLAQSTCSKNPVTGERGIHVEFFNEAPEVEGRIKFDEIDYDTSPLILFDYTHPSLKGETYYADVTTTVTPEESGEYDFSLSVCGTAQLFVEDKLVVDNKTSQTAGNTIFDAGTIEEISSIHLEAGKSYNVRIEFGSSPTSPLGAAATIAPGGALLIGFCKQIDAKEEIQKAADLARSVDKVILNIGLNLEWESEGHDRAHMRLPDGMDELVEAVLEANPNTVIVNQSGSPVEMPWLPKANGLLQAWFGGTECGSAIANVIFGEANPSGKLSMTWPFKNADGPAYLNAKTVRGRVLYGEDIYIGYRFFEKMQRRVAFPFGYGKSYTSFELSNLKVSVDEESDSLKARLSVKNTGKVDGAEVVQLYISTDSAEVDRPLKELKGFERIFVEAGKTESVLFSLSLKDSASYFDEYMDKWSLENGSYEVQVGTSSDDIQLYQKFSVKETKFWVGL